MMPDDEAALACWQSHRDTDRAILDTLLDECMCPPGYITDLEIVRHCMEDSEMAAELLHGIYDIGHVTKGVWDNVVDLSNTWAMYPERRREFGPREIQDLLDSKSLLDELVAEITKPKAEAA